MNDEPLIPSAAEPEREPDLVGDEFDRPNHATVAVSMFGGNPVAAYRRMTETVEVMKEAFQQHEAIFVKPIVFNKGKRNERTQRHITIEGWTFVGGLVGITARTKWTEYVTGEFETQIWVDDPSGAVWEDSGNPKKVKQSVPIQTHGYRAMAEAVTMDGAIVGASESLCLASEDRWGDADEYARKSMAQTRAKSQAIAGVLRFLVEMAGYKGTPAEEMTGVEDRSAADDQTERRIEGPRRQRHQSWGPLLSAMDEACGFTDGVSKGLLQLVVEAKWDVQVTMFSEIPDGPEAKARLHNIWWGCLDAQNTLGVAPTETIIEKWAEFWPEIEADKDVLADRIRAAAGEGVQETLDPADTSEYG